MDAVRIDAASVPPGPCRAEGYRVGQLVFLSGQSAVGPDGTVGGRMQFDEQVAETMRKIDALLHAAGSDRGRILKVTIYLSDPACFPRLIEMRRTWFSPPYPADTVVEVDRLSHPDALIEIDVTALAGGQIGS